MIWSIIATVAMSAAAIAVILLQAARWKAEREIAKILTDTERNRRNQYDKESGEGH